MDEAGRARIVFDDVIVDRLIEALARDERYPIVDIDVPSNRTMRLKISQTAQARTWWAVHELIVWQR